MALQYKIFNNTVTLPDDFNFGSGVSKTQNKKSVEKGFKNLQKWLKNPTPENWQKIFGRNNAFSYQIRNYLLNRSDLGSVKGMSTANAVFDQLNVKKLLTQEQIEKINSLTTGGKGVSLRSIGAKT